MKTGKKFKIPASEITQVINPMGSCIASDKITVDVKVGNCKQQLVDYKHSEIKKNQCKSAQSVQSVV
jgi:hypothetical protein